MGKVWRGYTSYLSFDVQVVTCSISLPASCMHTHAYLLGGEVGERCTSVQSILSDSSQRDNGF